MDKKFFNLFTIILFYLCSLSTVHAADGDTNKFMFPIDGGTTSDGIVVSNVNRDGFEKMESSKTLHVESSSESPSMNFDVNVPKGKDANMKFKLLLKIKMGEDDLGGNTNVSFIVKVDGKQVLSSRDKQVLCLSEGFNIPSGEHQVSFEGKLDYEDGKTFGYLDSLMIHIHQFNEAKVAREPICGIAGESYATCIICQKDSCIAIPSQYSAHSLVTRTEKKSSCLANAGQISYCEHCPYTEIKYSGDLKGHDFDANGTCKVCHLSMPKLNGDTTVVEIHNAGEMRVLAEMMQLGRIPGNIGIDIKSDLVFNNDTTMLPLGTYDHPFQGVLNGNGHRISGISNTYLGIDCLGFVGVAKGTVMSHAVIANLIFDSNNSLRGQACVGGIVGYATNCKILNCASFGQLEGTDNVGGLVGYADENVTLHNCAAVCSYRVQGLWNPMACGMPNGQMHNCYAGGSNVFGGTIDTLKTTTLRHCFSTLSSDEGLKQVSPSFLPTTSMVLLLNEESQTDCFTLTEAHHYPIPLVNTTIKAQANAALPKQKINWRRAMAAGADDDADIDDKPKSEGSVYSGYTDGTATRRLGHTIEEIMSEDSVRYANLDRLYIVTRSVPEGFSVYDIISGGDVKEFESFVFPADTSYFALTEYELVSEGKFKEKTEAIHYIANEQERIDEYAVDKNGNRSLSARITFTGDYDMVCQKNIDGIMRNVWNIQTQYDDAGNPISSNAFSYDPVTGEARLEFTETHVKKGGKPNDGTYEEYLDSLTNTIHVLFNDLDSVDGHVVSREHYILHAAELYPLEILTEKMIDGKPYLADGMYFVYDEQGDLDQTVAYGPVDNNLLGGELRPYLYNDYYGAWQATPYPTAIQLPTMTKPSLKHHKDNKVYDMKGRVVRSVTDAKDPFSGLPQGVYIYQGAKYLKRN